MRVKCRACNLSARFVARPIRCSRGCWRTRARQRSGAPLARALATIKTTAKVRRDEGTSPNTAARLPVLPLAVDRQSVPLLADLLDVRNGGDRNPWRGARYVA